MIVGVSPPVGSQQWCFYFLPHAGGITDYPKLGFNSTNIYLTDNDYDYNSSSHSLTFARVNLWNLAKSDVLGCVTAGYETLQGLQYPDGSSPFTIVPVANGGSPEYAVSAHYYSNSFQQSGESISIWSFTTLSGITTPTVLDADLGPANAFYSFYPFDSQSGEPTQPLRNILGNPPPSLSIGSVALDGRIVNTAYSAGHLFATQVVKDTGSALHSLVRVYDFDTTAVPQTTLDLKVFGSDSSDVGISYLNPSVTVSTASGSPVVVTMTRTGANCSDCPSMAGTERVSGTWSVVGLVQSSAATYYPPDINQSDQAPFRWGDYAGSAQDPTSNSIYIYNEYVPGTGNTGEWATWVARVDF
ncbi:MAG: hypothetical protein ACYDCC_07015 [Actinomycetota bacterium]